MEKPFEIVILSGKGGTGKTSVTAAFAFLSEQAVFSDCDVDAADLHLLLTPEIHRRECFPSGMKAFVDSERCTLCRRCMELCRFHAILVGNNAAVVDEYRCEGCGLCSVACPEKAIIVEQHENNTIYHASCRFGPMVYGTLGISEENSGRLVTRIREYAKETALDTKSDYIITDGPPGIGCPVIATVTGASLVVAVTEPTLPGWHDLQRLLSVVGSFHIPVRVIINKWDLNEEMSRRIERELKDRGTEVIGKLPYDEAMIFALTAGETINEFEPEGTQALQLASIWERVKECRDHPVPS